MKTLHQLRCEIENITRDLGFGEARTAVEQCGKWFHILIAASEFRGKSQGERENIIWREFERRLDDETILSITQCYLLTPGEQGNDMPAAGLKANEFPAEFSIGPG